MTSQSIPEHLVRFSLGDCASDASTNRVSRAARWRRIEPKQMHVLLSLARANGSVRTKFDLLDEVWPSTYVVEGTLKRAVSELRKALGDDARNPRYIETVYKVGYRLVSLPRPAAPREDFRGI
ncbi:MAG: winged helix-turn-helix domain-containing protein [Pseudomonadota bacterium]